MTKLSFLHRNVNVRGLKTVLAVLLAVFSVEVLLALDQFKCCGPEPGTAPCDTEGCYNGFPSHCAEAILQQISNCCGAGSGTATCVRKKACEPGTAWCVKCDSGKECGTCQTQACDPVNYCANGGCTPGYTQCSEDHQTGIDTDACNCCYDYSPIVVSLRGSGFEFSSAADGVVFDINGLGKALRIGWPVGSDDAWLALDRNGNGSIDTGSELFGNTTRLESGRPAANGYEALAEFDFNGDHWIDASDPAYANLVLWLDLNRDGSSQQAELYTLAAMHVERLGLDYGSSQRRDANGNSFRLRAAVTMDGGQHRFSYDVFPVVQ